MPYANIGLRIQKVRKENKLTQSAFAKVLGISQTHVSKIEKGIENPSETLIKFLCYKYCINEDWIKKGDGEVYLNPHDDCKNLFYIARHKYEKALSHIGDGEIMDSALSFYHVANILDCTNISDQDFLCMDYLKYMQSIFMLLRTITDSAKEFIKDPSPFNKYSAEEIYERLIPTLNDEIHECLHLGVNE